MTVTIIVAGKNNIACNVLKYLITKEKEKNTFSFHGKGTYNKTKILALPNENDDGIDNWQYSFKKTALDNDIEIINLKDAYTIENSIFLSCEFDKIIKPDALLSAGKRWSEEGVQIIGGCCGLSPEHIQALSTLKSLN